MSQDVTVNPGTGLRAEVFEPVGAGNGAAIIVAYGSEGMTDKSGPWSTMIHEFADELAAKSFTVLIPDYLAATGTKPAADVWLQIGRQGHAWQQAITDAATHARTLLGNTAAKVGLLGFSLGGHLCLRLRATTPALVAFYAPAIGLQPSGSRLNLDAQLHQGDDDNIVNKANAQDIDRLLRSEGARTELYPYPGANHGFTGEDASNTVARQDSRARTIAFFERHLRNSP